jgi:hypothetical protein
MIRTTTIGSQVFKYLKEEIRGSIVGLTSAGVFIKTAADKILFLTTGPYRGPLTINLEGDSDAFDQFENGMEVVIGSGEISIPATAFRIKTANADIWSSPLPQAPLRTLEGRRETLRAFAVEMLSLIKEKDYPEIYARLKAIAHKDTLPEPEPGSLFPPIQDLHQKAKAGDLTGAREALNPLLGLGEGLTPAGDDLLLGWLLTLNRWHETLAPGLDLQPLNRAIVTAAYEKTTTISANLLECAAQGEGDERLINVLDALMCVGVQHADPLRVSNLVKPLLSWGSSSGVYAFMGMGVAVGSMREKS